MLPFRREEAGLVASIHFKAASCYLHLWECWLIGRTKEDNVMDALDGTNDTCFDGKFAVGCNSWKKNG
eukprot:IDg15264t1